MRRAMADPAGRQPTPGEPPPCPADSTVDSCGAYAASSPRSFWHHDPTWSISTSPSRCSAGSDRAAGLCTVYGLGARLGKDRIALPDVSVAEPLAASGRMDYYAAAGIPHYLLIDSAAGRPHRRGDPSGRIVHCGPPIIRCRPRWSKALMVTAPVGPRSLGHKARCTRVTHPVLACAGS